MKGENTMQTNNQVIPELLEMTKLTAHENGLNNEIAAHLRGGSNVECTGPCVSY